MKHTPALYALKRLHADIGGQKHVEAVLKMLEPGFDLKSIPARRRNQANPYFGRGQIFRHVLNLLREAPAPMTTREIVS